ncbi:MAG TPA: hypothetical protein G4N98_03000 [Thermoflexia bacterium]|nr:hypothetical protein [Thermoflexia bacterium]
MKIRYMLISLIAILLVGGLVGSYYLGACPLDYEGRGICTGPCTAIIDLNADGICDRSQNALAEATSEVTLATEPTGIPPVSSTETPQVASWPSAGETAAPTAEATSTSAPPTPTSQPQTDCPFGLVNDPYPGECGRYVDQNENGICDHSEP